MKNLTSYTLTVPHITLHDLCVELGRGKQTVLYWVKVHNIPHTKVWCGQRVAVMFIPVSKIEKFKKLCAIADAKRDHKPLPGEAA